MKAVLCERLGAPEDLVVRDLATATPGPGEVVVRVGAAALNFFDTLLIRGKYQFRPSHHSRPGRSLPARCAPSARGWSCSSRATG